MRWKPLALQVGWPNSQHTDVGPCGYRHVCHVCLRFFPPLKLKLDRTGSWHYISASKAWRQHTVFNYSSNISCIWPVDCILLHPPPSHTNPFSNLVAFHWQLDNSALSGICCPTLAKRVTLLGARAWARMGGSRGMCIKVAHPFFESQARENVFSPLRPWSAVLLSLLPPSHPHVLPFHLNRICSSTGIFKDRKGEKNTQTLVLFILRCDWRSNNDVLQKPCYNSDTHYGHMMEDASWWYISDITQLWVMQHNSTVWAVINYYSITAWISLLSVCV